MKQFRQVLIDTLKVNKKLKVMGICFGHQFLAHSENIEVVTKTLDKGLLNINFSLEESADVPYLK
jgi:GMP synthase-like glutamine amidotransferase